MASRILRKPLKVMQKHVNALLGIKNEKTAQILTSDDPKFVIYSAHDDQVDSMMVFLTGTKESFDYIRYAAQVTFELLYSQSCVAGNAFLSQPGEDCFSVTVRFDGEPLKLPGCTGDGFSEDGSGCTYTEFKALIADVWYSGKYADDLDKACFQPVTDADLQPE